MINGKDPEKTLGAVDEYSTQRRYLGQVSGFRSRPVSMDRGRLSERKFETRV